MSHLGEHSEEQLAHDDGIKEPEMVHGDGAAMLAAASPQETQLDVSEVEVIADSPLGPKEQCLCHLLQWPDAQPLWEDWDVCDYCVRSRRSVTTNDMETEVEPGNVEEVDFGEHPQQDILEKSPPRKLRRLRPLVFDGPSMLDNSEKPEDHDVISVSWCMKPNIHCYYMYPFCSGGVLGD